MTGPRTRSLALTALLFVAACADGEPQERPAAACTMAPVVRPEGRLPADFPVLAELRLTKQKVGRKFVVVEGYLRSSVEEVFETSRTVVLDQGFDIINTDFEGFEAEIYFARASSIAGIVRLREGPCRGHVSASILYDPLQTARGRNAVDRTRELSGN